MGTINAIVIIIFAIFGIIGALIGFSKGLVRSAIKTATILLAVVVAFSVTSAMTISFNDQTIQAMDELLAPIADLFVASPTLNEYFPMLIFGLLKPIVFVVVLAMCLLVAMVVRLIVNLILKAILPKKKGTVSRIGGLALGLVCGVMIALCFVFPVVGYFTAVPNIYTNVKGVLSNDENPIDATVEETVLNLPNVSSAQNVNKLAGNYFTQLVTFNDGEREVSALDELVTITSIVQPALDFLNGAGDLSTMEGAPLREIAQILQGHTKLRTIATEIVNYASQKWIANEAFMGYNLKEEFDPEYSLLLNIILLDFATLTPDTIVDYLNDLADIIDTIQPLVSCVQALVNSVGSISTIDAQSIKDIAQIMDSNQELCAIATEVINYAAQAWSNDQSFLGVNLKEMAGADYEVVVDALLDTLVATTQDTLVADLNTLADLISVTQTVLPNVTDIIGGVSDPSTFDVQSIKEMAQIIGDNASLSQATAQIFADVTQQLQEDKSVMGIDLQEKFGDDADFMVEIVLSILPNVTQETLTDDLSELADTMVVVISMLEPAKRFANSVGSFSTLDDQAVRDIGQVLADNDDFRVIATEVINYASDKWLADDSFAGINVMDRFDADGLERTVLVAMLTDLSEATPDNVVEVLNNIANSIETVRNIFG